MIISSGFIVSAIGLDDDDDGRGKGGRDLIRTLNE